jgi:hypothetical protein
MARSAFPQDSHSRGRGLFVASIIVSNSYGGAISKCIFSVEVCIRAAAFKGWVLQTLLDAFK